jgi:hypothetical protein
LNTKELIPSLAHRTAASTIVAGVAPRLEHRSPRLSGTYVKSS